MSIKIEIKQFWMQSNEDFLFTIIENSNQKRASISSGTNTLEFQAIHIPDLINGLKTLQEMFSNNPKLHEAKTTFSQLEKEIYEVKNGKTHKKPEKVKKIVHEVKKRGYGENKEKIVKYLMNNETITAKLAETLLEKTYQAAWQALHKLEKEGILIPELEQIEEGKRSIKVWKLKDLKVVNKENGEILMHKMKDQFSDTVNGHNLSINNDGTQFNREKLEAKANKYNSKNRGVA